MKKEVRETVLKHFQWLWHRLQICLNCSVAQSRLTLWDPEDYSPSGSSVHGILQARILEWAASSFSRDLPNPGIEPMTPASPALAGGFFTTEPSRKPRVLKRWVLKARVLKARSSNDPLCRMLKPKTIGFNGFKIWNMKYTEQTD